MNKEELLRMLHYFSSNAIPVPPAILKYLIEFVNEKEINARLKE